MQSENFKDLTMLTVVENRNGPLQFAGVVFIFLIAVFAYLLFNAWHNTADAINYTQNQQNQFELNTNQYGIIDNQNPVLTESSCNAHIF